MIKIDIALRIFLTYRIYLGYLKKQLTTYIGFGGFGGKEPDDICYYLSTFYVVSVEFVATLNIVDTTLFKSL